MELDPDFNNELSLCEEPLHYWRYFAHTEMKPWSFIHPCMMDPHVCEEPYHY